MKKARHALARVKLFVRLNVIPYCIIRIILYYEFSAVMVLSEISPWMKSPCTILSHIESASIINLTLKPVIPRRRIEYFLCPSAPSIRAIALRSANLSEM